MGVLDWLLQPRSQGEIEAERTVQMLRNGLVPFFEGYGEQRGGEPDIAYWLRTLGAGPPVEPVVQGNRNLLGGAPLSQSVPQAFRAAADTPDRRRARVQQAQQAQQPRQPSWWEAAQLAAQRAPQATRGPAAAPITSLFQFEGWAPTGQPGDPRDGGRRRHEGWDFAPRSRDTSIRAARPFEVVSTRDSGIGGLTARVRFDNGQEVDVMHLDPRGVPPVGHRGGAGDVIAIAGRTGNATGISTHIQPAGGGAAPAGGGTPAPPGMEAWQQYAGQALAEVSRIPDPVTLTTELAPPPPLPAPAHYQPPDFSAGNAAFEQARPRNPFAEPGSENRLLRENFFRGMGEALMQLQPGRPTGFGELLLRAGSGALAGRMQGAEQVRQRMDRYDALMQQYQQQLAARQDQQAVATANTFNQNIELDNNHAYRQAEQNIAEHHRRNAIDVSGGFMYSRRSGEGNQVETTITPIRPVIERENALQRAQIFLQGAGEAQHGARMAWQAARTMELQYAALALNGGPGVTPQAQSEALLTVYAQTIMPAVESGRWRAWMQPEVADSITGRAFTELGIDPLMWNDPQTRARLEPRVNAWLTEYLVGQAARDPQWGQHILGTVQGAAGRAVDRVRNTRETTRTSRSRSGVSVSTTETYGQ